MFVCVRMCVYPVDIYANDVLSFNSFSALIHHSDPCCSSGNGQLTMDRTTERDHTFAVLCKCKLSETIQLCVCVLL